MGVGHVRYTTHGCLGDSSVQPFVVDTVHGLLAVAHNGELVNAKKLRREVALSILCQNCTLQVHKCTLDVYAYADNLSLALVLWLIGVGSAV